MRRQPQRGHGTQVAWTRSVRSARRCSWTSTPTGGTTGPCSRWRARTGRCAPSLERLTTLAVELLDLRDHRGAHPRLGVVDVVPFVDLAAARRRDRRRRSPRVTATRRGSRTSSACRASCTGPSGPLPGDPPAGVADAAPRPRARPPPPDGRGGVRRRPGRARRLQPGARPARPGDGPRPWRRRCAVRACGPSGWPWAPTSRCRAT